MNLMVTNIFSCCVLSPLALVDNLLEGANRSLCAASEGVAATSCAASVLAVLLIGIDQFCAVLDPLRYHTRINSFRSAGMMVGSWTMALVFGAMAALDPPRGMGSASLWQSCGGVPNPSTLYRASFVTIYSLLVFVLPFGALVWIYRRIYAAAHHNSQRARKAGSVDDYQPVSRSASVRSTSSSIVSSLRCRLSNASVFLRYREETRAARVSALVIVMALFCWLPYVAVLGLRAATPDSKAVPRSIDAVTVALLCSSAIISPALFAFRSRRIQRELRKILGMQTRKTSSSVTTRRLAPPRLLVASQMASVSEGSAPRTRPSSVDKSMWRVVRTKWHKQRLEISNIPKVALTVENSRSSFSSGGSTQGTTSTDE
ncbi:5-hydroxytryptamine receptor 6 isoform X2 [Anabrus simplex]